jgi:hypothetical protein
MAAFLSEMKSVRLRKVGGGGGDGSGVGTSGASAGGTHTSLSASGNGLARRWSAGGRPDVDRHSTVVEASSSLTRHRLPSFRSLGNRTDDSGIGEKRKRSGEAQDAIRMCLIFNIVFKS